MSLYAYMRISLFYLAVYTSISLHLLFNHQTWRKNPPFIVHFSIKTSIYQGLSHDFPMIFL